MLIGAPMPFGINPDRCFRLMNDIVGRLGLDLHGMTVLTEAATGNYALTASLAAVAGADEVLLLARDSRYASASEAIDTTRAVASMWGLDNRLRILQGRDDPALGRGDIVTNLGFVRPIDLSLIRKLKKGAVVPLMFEAWEYRAEDVDVDACERAGIPVAGTDEGDPRIGIFDYLACAAIRLLFELNVEVVRSSILVIGGGGFAQTTVDMLTRSGADVRHFDPMVQSRVSDSQIAGLDAAVVLEHRYKGPLLDVEGLITPNDLVQASPGIAIAHVAGGVNAAALQHVGIAVHPVSPAPVGYMSVRTDYVGPRPVIDLHAAGLRVGQALVTAVRAGDYGVNAARAAVTNCSLVQPIEPTRQLST